jgi:hypothetical protein
LILQVEKAVQVHRFTLLLLTSEIMQGWTLCFNCINHMSSAAYHHFFDEENPPAVFTNVMETCSRFGIASSSRKVSAVSTDRAVNPTIEQYCALQEKYILNKF